jgi:hypothetical protein
MTAIVPLLQIASGLAWLVVVALLIRPSFNLLLRGDESPRNARAVLTSFIAWTQFGFSARWLIFDHAIRVMGTVELAMWCALYLLSIIAALAIIRLHWLGNLDA